MSICIPKEISAKMKKSLKNGEIDANVVLKMLPEQKQALRSMLEEIIAEKLKIKVETGEVAEISKLSKVIDEAQKNLGDDLGNPLKEKENLDFFIAKKKMNDYLMSKNPAHKLKVVTGSIGRGMMLFSVKSPILNIGSNIELAFTEALTRRISSGQIKGTDNKLAIDFVKMANKIYQKTGYDISRMENLEDTGMAGERVLGQIVHTQGPGAVRKVGRWTENIVFKQFMGAPDVAFSSAHFADSINLNTTKISKDPVKAREIMVDAMKIQPKTIEGIIVRRQGILDAQKATWTDTTWASKVSEGIRKILNDVSGDLRIGDYVLPFVKTPANVIATGMEYAGMGIPNALVETYRAFKVGELGSRQHIQSITRSLVRSGLGLVGALIITSQLNDNDFMGAYDPGRAQIEQLKNSNYNSIKVGKKWISVDWLGPLAVPVTAMMYARKYGKTGAEKTFQYSKGILMASLNIPGVKDIYDSIKRNAYKKNMNLKEMTGSTIDYVLGEIHSRLVPSFISDIAKATDIYERQTGTKLRTIQSRIPGLRKNLPIKRNIFGELVKGEPGWSDILFGSRVKTTRDTKITDELERISDATDKNINFTDWDRSSSKTLAQFKQKIGEKKFNEAKIKYGKALKQELENTINKSDYRKLTDEKKLKVLTDKDTEVMRIIFKQYDFNYKRK